MFLDPELFLQLVRPLIKHGGARQVAKKKLMNDAVLTDYRRV